MKPVTKGIHHITAFATDPQGIVDFYAGVLGLRMVKRRSTSTRRKYTICTSATRAARRARS